MAMKLLLAGALVFATVASGADAQPPMPNTHMLSAEDLAFNTAAGEARQTLPIFAAKWRAQLPGYAAFRVKAEFRTDDGRGVEDLWIEPTSIDANGAVVGRLSDSASRIASFKQGGEVRAPADRVVDWMYVKDRSMYGQFTLRAQLGRMAPAQRAQFEAMLSSTPLEPGGQ